LINSWRAKNAKIPKIGMAEYAFVMDESEAKQIIKTVFNFDTFWDFIRTYKIYRKNIEDKMNGGLIWLLADCMAQKIDSPLKSLCLKKEIIKPKEFESVFRKINKIPP